MFFPFFLPVMNHRFDFDDTFRQQVKYALVIIALLIPLAAAHNAYITPDEDETTIGFCNVSITCNGYDAGVCLGLERRVMDCMDPREANGSAEEVNYAEVECALQAYKICEERSIDRGTEWAQHASYKNRTCQTWHDEEDAGLIDCYETYPPLNYPEP